MSETTSPHRSACMIAYANYFTDARIKNYVDVLLGANYNVDVFALGEPGPTPPGLHVCTLMPKVLSHSALPYVVSQLWFLLLATIRVGIASIRRRYAFVHVHNMPDFIVFAAIIPKLLGAKVILDIHDTMPEAYATKFGLPLDHAIIRAMRVEERLSAAFADHVITTNDLHKEVLIGHGIPPSKISIVMNVGNEKVFAPKGSLAGRNGVTLGYHGTIAERLGPDLILDAVRLARESCPGLRLVLIGDGEYMPTVRQLVDRLGLGDTVRMEGWVPVEELPRRLSTIDVGVVGNRRYTEEKANWMLPVKMLEYAAMEIPTIAPRLRVIEHYFDDSNAILYEPDDPEDLARCIRLVHENPSTLVDLKKGLRQFNGRYNWSDMASRYLALIEKMGGRREVDG